VFVAGHWDPALGDPTALRLLVDGRTHPPDAWRMPRPDLGHGARCGFWATVPVHPQPGPAVSIVLELDLPDGRKNFPLGEIEVEAPPAPAEATVGAGAESDRVAIAMATHEPDPELFRVQVESIVAQTHSDWVCFIGDDDSSPESFAMIEATVGQDPRFVVERGGERLGFYRNFERVLQMVPPEFELIAMSDQDDRWREDKLERLLGAIGDSVLVHSDARITDGDGRRVGPDLWSGRRVGDEDLTALLFANTVAGAASLFRRSLLTTVLPFPEGPGLLFHDHWIALAAQATGSLAYVDEPLYDYVQHTRAVTGNPDPEGPRHKFTPAGALDALDGWRSAYFRAYVQLKVQAMTLLARSPEKITPDHRRVLERALAADRSAREPWLAARLLRSLPGGERTLGAESLSLRGLLWKRAVSLGRIVPPRLWPKRIGTGLEPIQLDLTSTRKARRWRALRRGISE